MKNLNLVLLGLPSSGKSSLLGALQQVAQSRGTELGGSFVDMTGELATLRQTTLDEKYRPTRDEVAAYPIKRTADGYEEIVTIHDTSGTQAAAILDKAVDIASTGPLPETLADADGALLVIDASASPAELKQQFQKFITFLGTWQDVRGRAVQVGGLPVFLVLAQCDKIAVKGETHGQWIQRMEEAKRRVGEQFQKALADSRERSFGRIDVRVWATAIKRPVGDRRANEPYQVGELFQQVFDAAHSYRERVDRSSQTLHGALVGLGGFAALLLLVMSWYYLTQPTPEEAALEARVQTLLAGGQDNVSERVREPIEDRLKEIGEVKTDPAYPSLPVSVREQLEMTENAIEAYQRLNVEYQKNVRNPRLAQRVAELDQISQSLSDYTEKIGDWPDTRLAKRHQEWLGEVAALKQAIRDEEVWTRAQIQEGEKLRAAGGLVIAKQVDPTQREAWFKSVHDYQIRGRRHKSNDRVEGTTIPYRVVYQFDVMNAAERDWRQFKERLETLRQEALER